ncbi:tRNA (5-methylaminomethyl-2-thiouridylate)-methyltransferase [Caloranaerobacter azorensis DSM 13643]|uniref:tRNA-specific 2-thiouridylase MnmA n=1 Tax=Caloranaerobacter azorensis DSM 13643 TaxID=1121264 RepID=A0A1M5RUR3_9FIRM|nr:tRNA 2-thiouridine(34) synthase MnmA [Caloranaerobacter azorensis]SHH29909.1 tRNA (5-methylaminomethyl-2-thiouridylate)-methyltransferase [Caloranaerobacter azorensis DSM 13643]
MEKKRVVIGMSGGVDSSVAAYLLKEMGYEVIGVTMQIWQEKDHNVIEKEGGCCSLSAVEDARRVANYLGIPYYVMNFKDVFKEKVINYFIDEYGKGRTPNPCIACNRFVKFEELLRRAKSLGADYVATGHYAKIVYDEEIGRYLLKRSEAVSKDQTYVLYNLTQDQLKHILMPLGNIGDKEKVREIARELGLIVAEKPESQEICFIEDNDYGKFIRENADYEIKPGYFVDTDGNILGKHKGITHYTIGQRKGLGLALGKPVYVVHIDPEKNIVVVGDAEKVFGTELIANDLNFIPFEKLTKPLKVKAKIRYTAKETDATVYPIEEDKVKVVFDAPVRAITPGQSIVFYDGDIVVGGGTILKKIL